MRLQSPLETRLEEALSVRREKGLLRELRTPLPTDADFSSNDYLGLARPGPFQVFLKKLGVFAELRNGSGATGSRLLSGHSEDLIKLEETAAGFHGSERSLFFNSGYNANLSLLSCLPGRDDSIVYDELIHASVHDGMRTSRAKASLMPFLHNNLNSMRDAIVQATQAHSGSVLVCIETVYSMDGDVAPLADMLMVAHQLTQDLGRDVHIVADEAHAGGLYGENGEGIAFAKQVNLHPNLLARVVTFGKAFGAHGAVVLARSLLIQYLINYARPFIYSTALPPHSVAIVRAGYAFAKTNAAKRARKALWDRVAFFQQLASEHLPPEILLSTNGQSPIQGLLVPGNRECVELSQTLRKDSFDVYPIRSPTVPRGSERIRIIIHAHNTEAEIRGLINSLARTRKERAARL